MDPLERAMLPLEERPDTRAGRRANLLLHIDAPMYETVRARAEAGQLDHLDWRWDDRGRGVWIALNTFNVICQGIR